ncbi:ROK family protein [Clostridium swellfunianum]|uniref:ROK family protein n=1 Tax=Clostridium swellfunianum TaxID=1367462 RepID=UPI00202FC45A|nr:ROK family protein [Clostridium swellfunianum]MCM0649880.1 ROK family protein [Clostridium swellfunianum]
MRVLAFDIGGTAVKIGIINEKGEILESGEMPTFSNEGGEALMQRILKTIGEYKNIDRVGISSAGQVDSEEGKIIFASENLPGWTGMEIKKRIEEAYSIPAVVENDVNAAAIGEAYYGAAADEKSFLCLAYGTGIGGAIIEQGKIYRGAFGSAGEFGHIITHVGGKDCSCGGKGCYETYAATSALIRNVKEELGIEEVDGREIFKLLEEGNEKVEKILQTWIFEIMMGLVNFVHIFNPSLIVLGGGIMVQPYIINHIRENLPRYLMPNYKDVKIVRAKLGNNAGILGAAHMVMEA